MKEELENIDEFFRDELNDFSPELPDGTWDSIASRLDSRSSSRVLPLFWKVAASVAVLISTGLISIYLIYNKPEQVIAEFNQPEKLKSQQDYLHAKSVLNNNNGLDQKEDKIAQTKLEESSVKSKSGASVPKYEENNTMPKDQPIEVSPVDIQIRDILVNPEDINTATTNIVLQEPKFEVQTKKSKLVLDLNPKLKDNPQHFNWKTSEDAINKNKSSTGEWFIGGQAGPQYTHRTVKLNEMSPQQNATTLDYTSSNSNIQETGTIAYAVGINVEYKPARRFSIQSGIYFSKYSINSTASVSFINNDPGSKWESGTDRQVSAAEVMVQFPNNSVQIASKSKTSFNNQATNYMNLSDPGSNEKVDAIEIDNSPSTSSNYEYVEIPVIARYAIIDKRFNLQVLGGISTNILIKNYTSVDLPLASNDDFETQNTNTLNYSSTIGIGFGYDISDRITMSLEPQFKYFLGSQVYDANDVRPFSLGVFSGVKYRF